MTREQQRMAVTATGEDPISPLRSPLTRARALSAAVALADAEGISSLTMRRLAKELGVEAMSLYHHVANKDDILDGMVDQVFAEIALPSFTDGWRVAMRVRTISVRAALIRHPWAIGIMESRTSPGHATLRHHDAVLGCLRGGGFSIDLAGHAFALLDSYVYGFVLQEVNLPFEHGDDMVKAVESILPELPLGDYPHLSEFAIERVMQPGYSFGDEFDFGLEVILDALEAIAAQAHRRTP